MHQPLRHPRAPTLFPYPALPVTLLPRPLPKSRHPGIAPNGSTWGIPRTSADLTTHTPARSHLPAHSYDTDLTGPHPQRRPVPGLAAAHAHHTPTPARATSAPSQLSKTLILSPVPDPWPHTTTHYTHIAKSPRTLEHSHSRSCHAGTHHTHCSSTDHTPPA